MKTEVLIEQSLAKQVRAIAEASHVAFEDALEKALVAGIRKLPGLLNRQPYTVKPHNFGADFDPKAVLAEMDEDYDRQKMQLPDEAH